jgi:hypothetical protein
MKVNKGQFEVKYSAVTDISSRIHNVIKPFDITLKKHQMQVLLIQDHPAGQTIHADWDVYELILFNFI